MASLLSKRVLPSVLAIATLIASGMTLGQEAATAKSSVIEMRTNLGNIVIKLQPDRAPETVDNFLAYVDDGFYNSTIFHRTVPYFVIQGGGFDENLTPKRTRSPIKSESANGLKNLRGTIAMALEDEPDSAKTQFFINVDDNDHLDAQEGKNGFTVFGHVIEGIEVADRISEVETGLVKGHFDVPLQPVTVISIIRR